MIILEHKKLVRDLRKSHLGFEKQSIVSDFK